MSQIQIPKEWRAEKLEDSLAIIIGGDWGIDDSETLPTDYVRVRAIRGVDISKWDIEKGKNSALRLIKKSSLEN